MSNQGTEKATPLKRRKEREKGNLSKSKDFNNFLGLAAFTVVIFLYAKTFIGDIAGFIEKEMTMIQAGEEKEKIIMSGFKDMAFIILPVFAITFFFQMLNYVTQVGFLFSPKIIKPDPKKINPVNYIKNLFSRKTIVELVKSIVMLVGLGLVLYFTFKSKFSLMVNSVWSTWGATLEITYSNLRYIFGMLMIVIFIIAIIDLVFQRRDYERKLKMKKEDVKREHKDNEGDPLMKMRKKEFMYAMLENDASRTVPEATFIVNNPTHISVALRYKRGVDDIPVVVAKGEDRVALYIRSIAKEHGIPMVENKPLARSMYFNLEVGDTVQEDMYAAVIETLKYLIMTNQIENSY